MLEGLNCRDMQMDYDDSEFSIHNVELTEEVSSTVSPVLRPYDYEDAGHLSFDSLVENEVFLGITGQEDNQWIEEYSRGTSSSVVESRHDNVWSEAASSESVEMLLKSVGQGTLVTESSDEPGNLATNLDSMDPNLNQDDEFSHALETMVTKKLGGFLTTEELQASDERGNLATNLNPVLKQEDENNHTLEAMVTNQVEVRPLATEEPYVSDEPGSLATHMDPNLKQDDEFSHALETLVAKKVEGFLATQELDVSDEPGSLSINLDPNLKQQDENNHAQDAMVTNKEEEGVLATEELDESDKRGSLATNTDSSLNQDDESNHAHESMVLDEVVVLATEELDESDERGRLATNTDPSLNQDEETNHAHEAMVVDEEVGALGTEKLDASDEPGSLATYMDPNLKEDDGNNHTLEAIIINNEEEVLATEELVVSDEPCSLSINLNPDLKQDDEKDDALEAMITNEEEEGVLATNMDPNLKQDDENNHAQEAMVTNKEEGVLATEELVLSDEHCILATNSDPDLKQDDVKNHAHEATVIDKEVGALVTEKLDASDEPGSVATNMDPSLNQDDENNHAQEAAVTNNEEEKVPTTGELVTSDDEPDSLSASTDPLLKQDDGNNHAQEASVVDKVEDGVLATEEFNVSDEPGSLPLSMDTNLKQDDGKNYVQETMVADKEVWAFVTEELDASDDPDKLITNVGPNKKQDDVNSHAQETMIINKSQERFDCDEFSVTVTKDSQEVTEVSGGKLDSDVFGNVCDFSEEKVDGICVDVNHEARNIAVELSENKLREDISTFEIDNGDLDASKECDLERCQSSSDAECSTKNTDNPVGSLTAVETCTNSNVKPSNVDSLNKPPFAVDILVDEESMPAESCNLLMTEACAEVSHDSKCAATAFPESCELNNDFMHEDLPPVTVEDDDKKTSENLASLELNVCSPLKVLDAHVEEFEKPDCAFDQSEMGEGRSINDTGTNMTNTCSSAELISGNTDLVAIPKVHSGDSSKDQSPAANFSDSVQQQINDEVQSSEQHGGTLDMDIAALDSQQDIESVLTAEGGKAQGSEADVTILAEPAELIAGNTDLVATPKVHSGDSSKDQGPAANLSDSVQQQINDEVPSSEQHGGTLDMDIAALDSQQDIESVSTAEGCKAQGSEADIAILAEPGYIDATSPILGVTSSDHHDNEKNEEGFVSDETCENESIKVGSMMDCASLSVVETGAYLVHAGEILRETSVENMHAVVNDLAEEANPDDMGGWSTPSTVDPILCDSSTKAGDNSEAGIGMQESISGHHVNMSSEQPVSTDVVLTSECNDSHTGHDEDSSVSMEKLQSLSPLSNTISTESAIDENFSFPEATEDVSPSEDAIDENTSFPEATEDVKPGEGDMNENTSLLEATEDAVLTSEYDENHMGNEEDTSGSMDAVQAVSPPLTTNNAEPFPSTRVEPSEGDIIENTPLPEATEDAVLTSQCDDSNTRHEEDTSVSMDTRVKPCEGAISENTSLPEATEDLVLTSECEDSHTSYVKDTELPQSTGVESSEGVINENTSLPEAAEHVVLTSECDDSHMKHADTSVSVDILDSVSPLLNTNNTELSQSTRVKSIEDAIDENTSLSEAAEDVVLTSERDDDHMMHGDNSVPIDELESVSPVVNKNITELSRSARVTPSEGAINENTSLPEATEEVQAKEHSVSSNGDVKTDKSFTFDVSAAAGLTETCTGLQLFSASQSMAMEGSCIDFSSTLDPRKPNASPIVTQTPGSGTNVATKERKRRRKSVAKESAEKGKETATPRSRRVEKSSPLLVTSAQPTSPAAAGQVIQFQESVPKEKVECSVTKPAPISNLPDLNNSTSIFHQPFTNNQQVQLRAQILVYGSLISGVPPEEAHMIAAFEQSDAGRKTWEDVWRACLERVHSQKSQANTPIQQPRSDLKDVGYRTPDLGVKHSSILSSTYKGTPPAVSPFIPVPTPLWNMSTPSCVGLQSRNAAFQHQFTPIHHPSYQTTPNPLWLSQSPFLGQWGIASLPGSPVPRFSGSPITEAVKLTPVNVSGVGPHPHSIPVVHSALFSPLSNDDKKASGDPKSRKRKNVSAAVTNVPSQVLTTPPSAHLVPCTGARNRTPFLVENQTDSVTTSVTVSAPPASISSSPATVLSVHDMLKRVEEGNVQQAYVNATDSRSIKRTNITTSPAVNQASVSPPNQTVSVTVPAFCTSFPPSVALSTPVSTTSYRSQNMKNALAVDETLSKVEESMLQAEDAALLAAAEVSNFQNLWSGLDGQNSSGVVSDAEAKLMSTISAAAAVATMASAAAKIATNVVEQAKLMADEVFQSSKTGNFSHIPHPNVVNKATPASILKSMDKTTDSHSNSVISAAREAARRRIEAASAASKHAENLDAIVKAAELASEAVSQVGNIVAMGDSSALRKIAEAGPDGFWNASQLSYDQHLTSNSGKKNASGKVVKEIQTLKHGLASPVHLASNMKKTVTNDGSIISNEKDIRSPHAYVVGHVIPLNTPGVWEEHNIKEGCLVEVYKENGKYKGAWLAANVLSLKDEKALICYTGMQSSDEENVKEWVAFEVKGSEEVPSIRIAHPMTTMRFEGARKRRRTAVTDYAWSKGDRVDVWMQDCWREGIVVEPNKIDVTTLTVQFPAQGETSVVRSWHVRPTLIWKDRRWIEWNGVHTSQGELPKEKRMKLGSPAAVIDKRKDKLPVIVESGTHEEQGTLLPLLSSQETGFNIGKNTHKPTSNLPTIHKDKARVVFGVPKPGKKQKFMAVSTQYVDDGTNKNITASSSNSLLKLPKSYGARVTKTDAVENQVAETKSKLKPRKPPVPWFRTATNRAPEPTDADSVENSSTRQNQTQVGPSSNKRKEPLRGPPAKKGFTFTSKPKSDPPYKGRKLPPPPPKKEVKDKSDSQVDEPRRSNRRIQPTSRLLEGLQSSLPISKIPSVSHAAQRKATSKGNTSHGST